MEEEELNLADLFSAMSDLLSALACVTEEIADFFERMDEEDGEED